ncbi:chaperone NapD [Alsobacter sp. SYSU BS001988]|jgi:nitrate reductase NapD
MNRDAPSRRDLLTGRVIGAGAELHVSSLVVHVRPDRLDAVRVALAAMAGVEVHGGSAAGKLVVTLETLTEHDVVQSMGAIGELPGVLSTALVYHRFEPSAE